MSCSVLLIWSTCNNKTQSRAQRSMKVVVKHKIECGAVKTPSVFSKLITIGTIGTRYGVYFVSIKSCLGYAWVTAILYAISCFPRPRYNDTQLYIIIITDEFSKARQCEGANKDKYIVLQMGISTHTSLSTPWSLTAIGKLVWHS